MAFEVNNLTPAELRAIEDHKWYMSIQEGREVTIDEAIVSFFNMCINAWRKWKTIRDNLEQSEEIQRHRYLESEKAGYDVGKPAEEQWVRDFAALWREWRESLEKNGFMKRTIVVRNEKGLHVRPSGTLVEIAKRFDCSLYVHKDGMKQYNFLLNYVPFMNVKSVLAIVEMCACMGDALTFIAYGRQAADALNEIERIAERKFEEAAV